MPIVQQSRMISIKTALPDADILGLRSFACQEQISRLFQIEAELSSNKENINFDDVVGNPASIRLNIAKGNKRYFNGYVSRFVQLADKAGFSHYRATIVPWLWFLTRTSDCRIFQNKKVSEIIEAVFKGHGFTDYQLKLSGTYQPKEYCVQYRETDFNFVSRLMEQEGIYYYFDHTNDGKCNLVLADSASAHKPFPNYDKVDFRDVDKGTGDREVITDWTMAKEVQPVATVLNDFDFTKPKTSLLANDKVTRKYGKAEYEMYDYPGDYTDHTDGTRLATVRLNELQTQYEVFHGQASARGLAAGFTFELKNHSRPAQNHEYLITSVSLRADAGEFASTPGGSGQESFSCSFTCIDKSQQFRPTRLTPTPIVQGPQTAIVTGPSGEKIYPDNYGRVKVQFPWDRQGKNDENSSCWIRVSQSWAGKQWGDMSIPHVGDEVIVEFLEGDPDRPIITGRVYNQASMPPLDLSKNKDKRIWQDDFGNRIVFDATPGDEHIRIFSPHHKSGLTLGRSSNVFSESNQFSIALGDVIQAYIGAYIQSYNGGYWQQTLGPNINTVVGGDHSWKHGASTEWKRGPAFKWSKGPSFEDYEGGLIKVSEKNVIVSSKECVNLVGGEGKGKASTSILRLQDDVAELSIGAEKEVTPPKSEAGELDKYALAFPLIAAAVAALGAVYVDGVNNDSGDEQSGDIANQTLIETFALAVEVIGIVYAELAVRKKGDDAMQTKLAAHDKDHEARLTFHKDGTAELLAAQLDLLCGDNAAISLADERIDCLSKAIKIGNPYKGNFVTIDEQGDVTITGTQVKIKGPFDAGGGALTVNDVAVPTPGDMTAVTAPIQAALNKLQADFEKQQAEHQAAQAIQISPFTAPVA